MATKEEIMDRLSNSVIQYKRADAIAAANECVAEKIDPVDAINDGLVKGMNVIGDLYAQHKIYLPQVLTAASAMYGALDILLPLIPKASLENAKKCVTAVMEGDVHDIGKNIVKTMLTAGGFVVTDLGKDVPPATIAGTVESDGIDIACLSTLMTPTMDNMKKTLDLLNENGVRGNCIVTIGGPPTSPDFAKQIGADHRDNNAQDCVKYLKERV
ncbi:MAG: B12-binding domain-containing protein [Candidatus Methanomethylophilus sp.]|jgi:methanogenic corrinoid protein MtbC1|nr:B12-binding domain-containing protein [Methanomethylophilus sp.]MCI2075036.1 B12-binding domain-containing protein [Methanomethylophilus sp.]MCI2092378.1 B12-binding domain-containing protein [Methanomethylophilus sp.]MEE3401362.1 B12-binding domain-containing protein [Methanomethylophilus sp.]WII08483.1 B12-binding domain-containing protein [Methanomassiliicoccales archaeon LGM-DZ1]